MANVNADKIVVWERSNKSGKWCPYSSEICQFLEKNFLQNVPNICLGEIEKKLQTYTISFKDMIQVSEVSGTKSPLRRHLYDKLCVLGRGFSWQWLDDHDAWITYDVEVNNYIDIAYLEGQKSVSLSKKFPGYCYEIVFSKMIQINKRTKRKRKVHRIENTSTYPIASCSEIYENDVAMAVHNEMQHVLSPEFLSQEIPGTEALVNQVNTYKRNVESPDCLNMNIMQDEASISNCSKHMKYSSEKKQDKNFHLNENSSMSTVALVNGRPWTDTRPPHTPQSKIKPVPGIEPLLKSVKPKKAKLKGAVASCPEEPVDVLKKYTEVADVFNTDETCIICCESLSSGSSYDGDSTVSKLTLCSHIFHKACLKAMYNSGNKEFLQCPSCKTIHGEKCGSQPPGEMIFHVLPYSLPSYPENDTIRIIYDIYPGIQGPEHPNPGKKYTARGFPRHCYLPDNEMGRKVLRLLIKAWKRRLIFTVGQSSTTSEENTVTWNEIHHKTEFGCNRRGHGYPDSNYFNNILAELKAHGITDDEVHVWYPV